MFRILPSGPAALLVECADTAAVQAWDVALRQARCAGELVATEIVPAANTVLLDGVPDPAELAARLRRWPEPPPPHGDVTGPLVEVPTRYDGPDLGEVARRWHTDVEGVVAIHTAVEFRVAFCGFAPGFAYLIGLPARYHVPRHPTPRPRVPAGSVALAGEFAGVYPTTSPGGWQLLGRTGMVLFDVSADPPTRLTAGTRVRFTEAAPG